MALRWLTAGESHGPGLTAILDGLPAGLVIDLAAVDAALARRQAGYGRSARMRIEHDSAEITAGVRHGRTLGSPLALHITNRDHANWSEVMSPFGPAPLPPKRVVTSPRPGHADFAAGAKFRAADLRDVLERASARETAARVGLGAVCRQLLAVFGVEIASHTRSLGEVVAAPRVPEDVPYAEVAARAANDLACLDAAASAAMIAAIEAARQAGDTVGGVIEAYATGLAPGLGSLAQWDRRLDSRIGGALFGIPAVKGVEFGPAFANARLRGSQVHDAFTRDGAGSWCRSSNRAGGLEGGITNGEALVVRVAMKPLATLMHPLATVDLASGEPARAAVERSDVCAVPACGVVVEATLALVLADAWLEKFGGDTLADVEAAHARYREEVGRWSGSS